MAENKSKARARASRRSKSSTERIFGDGVMAHGYTGVPNILVRAQHRLGLNPVQFNILVQLLSYWMDPERPPYPPKRDLLQRTGISESTLKKHIKELEQGGFIEREQQTTAAGDFGSNIYHMQGLVAKLQKLVPDFDKERQKREEGRRDTEKLTGGGDNLRPTVGRKSSCANRAESAFTSQRGYFTTAVAVESRPLRPPVSRQAKSLVG